MNSKILKLDAPYNIIYAGGRVGRHIATMTIWDDDDMGIYGARQYAMIDMRVTHACNCAGWRKSLNTTCARKNPWNSNTSGSA